MVTPTTTPRTGAAIESRRVAAEAALRRVEQVPQTMRREGGAVSVTELARRAEVSCTFLYQNNQARDMIVKASDALTAQADRHQPAIQAAWRERALNAEQQLHHAHDEILSQRTGIGGLLGQIRDLEAYLPPDGVQRVLTENHTLKAKLRQTATDIRRLEDRLAGARDNNRFLDKRIATLETDLVHAQMPAGPMAVGDRDDHAGSPGVRVAEPERCQAATSRSDQVREAQS